MERHSGGVVSGVADNRVDASLVNLGSVSVTYLDGCAIIGGAGAKSADATGGAEIGRNSEGFTSEMVSTKKQTL